jgi:hypothetical protein
MNSIHPLQQTAAAMPVSRSSLALRAAAAAERGRSAAWQRMIPDSGSHVDYQHSNYILFK